MFEPSIKTLPFEAISGQAALVIGNGPSLKGFDFDQASRFTTFGMNSAYRYWRKIGWYPDYYCCLDEVVGESHKSEIAQLIMGAERLGIKGFFLTKNVADSIRHIAGVERVYVLEDLIEHYPVFGTTTVTTGTHSALFAAFLGLRKIFLVGVDCNYVERVSGSEATTGIELKITKQEANPNYFFDDYQKVGDRYNLPNPSRNIHLATWREAALILDQMSVETINANLVSRIDCFDFCTFNSIDENFNTERMPAESVLRDSLESAASMARSDSKQSQNKPEFNQSGASSFHSTPTLMSDKLGRPEYHRTKLSKPTLSHHIAKDPQPIIKIRSFASRWERLQNSVLRIAPTSWRKALVYFLGATAGTFFVLQYEFLSSLPLAAPLTLVGAAASISVLAYSLYVVRRNLTSLLLQTKAIEARTLSQLRNNRLVSNTLQAIQDDLIRAFDHLQDQTSKLARQNEANDMSLGDAIDEVHEQLAHHQANVSAISGDLKSLDILIQKLQDEVQSSRAVETVNHETFGAEVTTVKSLIAGLGEDLEGANLKLAQQQKTNDRLRLLAARGRAANARLNEAISGLQDSLQSTEKSVQKRLDRSDNKIKQLRDDTSSVANRLSRQTTEIEKEFTNFITKLDLEDAEKRLASKDSLNLSYSALQSELATQANKLEELSNASVENTAYRKFERQTKESLIEANTIVSETATNLRGLQQKFSNAFSELQQADNDIKLRISQLPGSNILKYQTFSRSLSDTSAAKLSDFAKKLNVSTSTRHLYYVAAHFSNLELLCRGRLATNIEDIILRSIVCSAVDGNSCRIMEIGSLFGIGLGLVYNYCHDRFDQLQMTAIDPLDGYYGKGVRDIITDIPIDVSTFAENVNRLGVPTANCELVQRFSFDKDVYSSFEDESYDVIIIDGDHTYSGVKQDFELYQSKIKIGGYVVFDDYASVDWPDVQAYVDKEVATNTDFEFVAFESRTCVYRRTK